MCSVCQSLNPTAPYTFDDVHAALSEFTDAAADISTIYSMSAFDTFNGALTATSDEDWIEIVIPAGENWTVNLQGISGTTDPIISLYSASGSFVSGETSYDAINNTSTVVYDNTSGTDVTLFIVAVDYGSNNTGGYQISISTSSPPFPTPLTEWTNEQIADQLTSGYWDQGGDYIAWDIVPGDTLTVDLTRLTAEGITLASTALEAWAMMTGIAFDIITDPALALVEDASGYATVGSAIIFDDDEGGAFANFNAAGLHVAADGGIANTIDNALVNVSTSWISTYGANLDGYSFQTYIHEIGHALGLGHAGNYNGSATYPDSALYLNDSWQATVMSYFDQDDNTNVTADFSYVITPMVADIIAMHNLYGASGTIRTGDTTYGNNSTAGGYYDNWETLVTVAFTILDDGGIDTIDISGSSAASLIDLTPGTHSNLSGTVGNMFIFGNTIIENAITGGGADHIYGNLAENSLNGGAGHDDIHGDEGADWLYGAQGHDQIYGDAGNDILDGWTGNDTIDGGAGDDTLDLSSFGTGVLLALATTTVQTLSAAAGADIITGIENVYGSIGGDSVSGTSGVNVLDGFTGNDQLFGLGGSDVLFGGNGNDTLRGGSGADSILGGEGRDYMSGSSGVDVFFFTTLADSVAGGFRDRIQTFVSGEDKVDLSALDAITGGADDNFNWIGTSAFGGSGAGALRYVFVASTGNIILEADVNGDGIRDFSIEFQAISILAETDFLF